MSKLIETREWEIQVRAGGHGIKEMIQQRGVTQDELAEDTGIPKSLISRYVNGQTEKPSLEDMVKIFGAFGLSPNRAAQDFGLWKLPAEAIEDPLWEEMKAIVLSFWEHPHLKDELVRTLLITSKVFAQVRGKETA